MSCDTFQAGAKIEALVEIPARVNMGAPVDSTDHAIRVGDLGEVTVVRRAGSLHWLVVKWDRLGRTFNLNADQFDLVKIVE